jgi:ABC-type dipeptide/oligopeptide/nickel transport system permease component
MVKMLGFLVDAVFQRDYPVVQDAHMLIALFL